MTDSPLAEDYDQYRLLDGEVVEVSDPHHDEESRYVHRRNGESKVVADSELQTPTRLHLQLAGDDSPGGLLEEEDIREGDFCWHTAFKRLVRITEIRTDSTLPLRFDAVKPEECFQGGGAKEGLRLATPAELREASITTPENGCYYCKRFAPREELINVDGRDGGRLICKICVKSIGVDDTRDTDLRTFAAREAFVEEDLEADSCPNCGRPAVATYESRRVRVDPDGSEVVEASEVTSRRCQVCQREWGVR